MTDKYKLHHSDAVQWCRDYEGPLFHALLCDAPYEMQFMNKGWDGSGVAFNPDTWRAFAKVLYPGAFLFVFAGTVNDDLISVAMREAGLRKYHKMMGWAYGSGFPKASRIDTQIDKAAGADGERGEITSKTGKRNSRVDRYGFKENGGASSIYTNEPTENRKYIPATSLARAWAGHRYGLQALKPAIETILIFQKPYESKPVESIVKTGAGALNIEKGRIGTSNIPSNRWKDNAHPFGNGAGNEYETVTNRGRWPANFILLDSEAAEALDRQSGNVGGGKFKQGISRKRNNGLGLGTSETRFGEANSPDNYGDEGGASRFFFCVQQQIEEAQDAIYTAKADRNERDAGLDNFEEQIVSDGRTKSIDNPYLRGETSRHNSHPTVKPLDLTRYLASLLLPPDTYSPRRLFVPFAGVASEIIGAIQAGWDEVEGVELTEEYIDLAKARIKQWKARKWKWSYEPAKKRISEDQMSLF